MEVRRRGNAAGHDGADPRIEGRDQPERLCKDNRSRQRDRCKPDGAASRKEGKHNKAGEKQQLHLIIEREGVPADIQRHGKRQGRGQEFRRRGNKGYADRKPGPYQDQSRQHLRRLAGAHQPCPSGACRNWT
jgi:hypothetical protein